MPSIGYKLQSERVKATSIANLESQVTAANLNGVLYSYRNFESESNIKLCYINKSLRKAKWK